MPIWALQLLLGVAFHVASTLIQQNLNAQRDARQKSAPTGLRSQYETGDVQPRSIVFGTFGMPGKFEYENSWGTVGDTPRANLVRVFSFGDVPVDGFDRVYVNGMPTTKTSTGESERGFPVLEYNDGGAEHLWWRWHDGSETVADDYLVSKFAGDEVYEWTEDYIGRGIPHIVMSALWNRVLWGGKFPDFMVQVRGVRQYDPRKDTTAGGSGSHRADDQSTWEFTDNPMVIAYNILRLGIRWNGEWVWGRRTPLSAARFPYDDWSVAMNECDVEIALLGGGTEKQFRVGFEVKVTDRPIDVVNRLMASCNAQMAVSGGLYYVQVGTPTDPVATITDTDVFVTESSELEPFPAFERIINGATGTYLDPEEAWERKDAEPYYRDDLESSDRGQRHLENLDLQYVFSGTQVQRLLQSKVKDARRFVKHAVPLRPRHKALRPLQVIAWNSDHNAYSGKEFQVMSRAARADGIVLVSLREIEPTDHSWDPETDEQEIVYTPTVPQLPGPQLMTGWSAVASARTDDNGNNWGPSVIVSYAGGLPDVRAVAIEVREGWVRTGETEKLVVFAGETPYDPGVPFPSVEIPMAFERHRVYEVRGRLLPFSPRVTRWSNQDEDGVDGAWLGVMTLNIPTVAPGGVDIVSMSQELQNITGPIIGDIYTYLASIDEQLGSLANVVMDNHEFAQRKISGVSARSQNTAAAVLRVEEVILGPGSAFASLQEQVAAVVENVYADGLLKIETDVNELTGVTTILLKAQAQNGVVTENAAIQITAEVTGPTTSESSILMMADKFTFISVTDEFVTMPFEVNATFVQITSLRIKDIASVDGVTFVLDGEAPGFLAMELA